ncbi:MAG: hypothetical protein RI883_884 [Bacteroidota bacterium]|jgi:hypothetical protein
MRPLYAILFVVQKYALLLFYPRTKTVNSPKGFLGRTIYVSNHCASFMDPLVVASYNLPILFFMTRSDVFTPISRPVLWAAHSLPIYRQHDGMNTKNENEKAFATCIKILKGGRNLLVFGEGFTDDVFIRRLKPVKKGAVRIGFITLEAINWEEKIYLAAVGCNYSDPNEMRSDVLVSTSDKICLNDYKEQYESNPNKVINDLTKKIESLMKDQITHVEDKNWLNFHENIMKLTRKGMNAKHSNTKIPLIERWKYSKKLANWLNEQKEEQLENLQGLKDEMERYFSLIRKLKINENYVHEVSETGKLIRTKELSYLFLLLPFAILGFIHCSIPYFIVKRFVEKTFKRRVFWASVKLILGMIFMGLLNIPVIFLFKYFIFPSYLLGFVYYALIGVFGLAAYMWWINFVRFKEKGIIGKMDLSKIVSKRKELVDKIQAQIPVA